MHKELMNISPIDGRYYNKTGTLRQIFSEFGLIKYRVIVEIKWLLFLNNTTVIKEVNLSNDATQILNNIIDNFNIKDAINIKNIEKTTNHDVKAVEYFLKEKINTNAELLKISEFIHFACTSEDINNLSYAQMLVAGKNEIILIMQSLKQQIIMLAKNYANTSMLAKTHGQTASPTTLGKEMANFADRLNKQITAFSTIQIMGKFNGAVGNFNAHLSAYPDINWQELSQEFISSLGINYTKYSTQIEPHDYIAEYLQTLNRFNIITIDFCRDIWSYISIGYFKQKIIKNEVGSSTMPHKVNPIDFENAEGNLGISIAINNHLADKLPISRLQRDLSDSTVLRNLGVGIAHSSIAYQSIIKGINKLEINNKRIQQDLDNAWEVLAEPIQTVMRRYGVDNAYEKLKNLSRGKKINQQIIISFIDKLDIPLTAKNKLKQLTPENYIGYAASMALSI